MPHTRTHTHATPTVLLAHQSHWQTIQLCRPPASSSSDTTAAAARLVGRLLTKWVVAGGCHQSVAVSAAAAEAACMSTIHAIAPHAPSPVAPGSVSIARTAADEGVSTQFMSSSCCIDRTLDLASKCGSSIPAGITLRLPPVPPLPPPWCAPSMAAQRSTGS